MKTNMKVLIGVLALAVIGASVYFSKSELQKGATRRPAGPQPDYEISSIIVDPANPVEGENFKISVTVKNKSSTTAATVPSKTLLHLSGQPLPIATTQPLGPLATEEEVWQTTSTQRRLLIRSCADADRAIAESNERNNCRERTLDLLPPQVQEQPPPPLPLCTEGQYNCESWTACSAEGSQTGTICSPNSPGTCLAPLGPTRACTPPPPPMPDLVIQRISDFSQDPITGNIDITTMIGNIGTANAYPTISNPLRRSAELIDSAGNYIGAGRINIVASGGNSGNTTFTFQAGTWMTNISHTIYPQEWRRTGVNGIRFIIDSPNNINESNETNNTVDIAIPAEFLTWVNTADLQINRIDSPFQSPPSSQLIAGNPLYFSSTLWNAGSTTAPASTTTLTINGTGTSAALGEVYRQDTSTPELAPGQAETLDDDLEGWPSPIEGRFIVTICADSGSVVTENRRWNNCASRFFMVEPAPPPPMPDFVIDSATIEQDAISGAILARATIRNAGTADAFVVNPLFLVVMTTDGRGGPNPIAERVVYSNGNSGSSSFTFQAGTILNVASAAVYPDNWRRTGANGIRLSIDSSARYNESNETNNTYDIAIPPEFLAWTPPPNLFIHWNSVTINPASPTAGSPVNFSAVIWNMGSTTAPASTARLIISGTSTSGVYYEAYRQNISIPELSAVNSATANFEWPSAIEGSYTPQVCADSENVISEISEYDNCGRSYRSGIGYPFTVAPAPSE